MRLNVEKKKHLENIVLMVDDDSATRQLIRRILSASCRIIDSIDPAMLAHTYQQFLPNIVLMDEQTSYKNGHDSVKEILEYDPEAFIVILSRDCTQGSIVKSKERGAKGFIAKPLNREALLKYIALAKARHQPNKPVPTT